MMDAHGCSPADTGLTFAAGKRPALVALLWSRRTSIERCLMCLLLPLLIALVALCAALATRPRPEELCSTRGCVEAAANIMKSIDTAADPCDDFYAYACGQWNSEHPIPDDMATYGTFSFVRNRVREQIRRLLESPDDSKHNSSTIHMAKLVYSQCMDTARLHDAGAKPLLRALEQMGGWPLLHRNTANYKDDDVFDLTQLIIQAKQLFVVEGLFSLYVFADAKDTKKNIIYLDQVTLTLGRATQDYYGNSSDYEVQMNAYREYMIDVATLLAHDGEFNVSRETLRSDITDMLDFERRLAGILTSEEMRRNHSELYNLLSIREVTELMRNKRFPINFLDFLNGISPKEVAKKCTEDFDLVVTVPAYFERLAVLLNETKPRDLKNYIVWRVVHAWARYLDERFDIAKQKFMQVLTGQEQRSSRWKECAPGPLMWLPMATGSLYVREHFDVRDKREALRMIEHLTTAFVQIVHTIDWMDDNTKQKAIDKALTMRSHIGYPDFILNDTSLDDWYKGLLLDESRLYFENIQVAVAWMQARELKRLLEPFNKDEFDVSPAVVNAFYSPEKNAITFPAGILQPPFFNGAYPKSINYGAIGAVIGHEITHGFDDQGSQFDKEGNLANWWNEQSFHGFNERKQCMIRQYSGFMVPNTNRTVNGILTQGENIADNGGVKEAFKAYRKYVSEQGQEEPPLPGLQNFTHNQLFFLSYAHFWCGQKKLESAIQQIMTDEHSPEIFRVIGVLSNLNEFAEAFSCAPGTNMNPLQSPASKCSVW